MSLSASAGPYVDLTEPAFIACHNIVRPYTMTSTERLYALFKATQYVAAAGLPGDFAECGVWRGGSVMMMALALKMLGISDRNIYLFDTFEGMTPPTDVDEDFAGVKATELLAREGGDRERNIFMAYAPKEEVLRNLRATGYPMERFVFVRGDVKDTLPLRAPDVLSLLRLDTDWYDSTRHELECLFPRLTPRGILIIDDYGYHKGSRKAVDEYFEGLPTPYLMNRIDFCGRLIVKA
jgi:O-methyltransferase